MKKIEFKLYLIKIFSSVSFLVSLFSGIVMWKILPTSSCSCGVTGLAKIFLSFWTRAKWADLYVVSSFVFVGLVILYLILQRYWVKKSPKA